MGVVFQLTDEQQQKADDWMKEHSASKHKDPKDMKCGAIGGRYTYCFTGTTLGGIAKVHCSCGEAIDLTDYAEW